MADDTLRTAWVGAEELRSVPELCKAQGVGDGLDQRQIS